MISYLFINIWPEFAELLDKPPITIHEFHSTGVDCLNKKKNLCLFKIYYVFFLVMIIKCGTDSSQLKL